MRTSRLTLFPLLALLLFPLAAFGAGSTRLTPIAKIGEVTVYPDRAMTTRSATLLLKAGNYQIAFTGLPALLEEDSIRVAGKGSAAATITGVEIQRVFEEHAAEQRIKELDDEIAKLERAVSAEEGKKRALAAQRSFVESIRVAWGERISKELALAKPTGAELGEALAFVGSGINRIEEQLRDSDAEQRRLKERIDALRRQREAASGGEQESKTVEVAVTVRQEGELTLDLSAVTPQAGWVPAYDVALAKDGASANLTFRALIRQQTGEDWQGVKLALSTARPATGSAPPQLFPWRIAFFTPAPYGGMMPRGRAVAKAMPMAMAPQEDVMMAEMAAEPAPAPAQIETAALETGGAAIGFAIPRPLDIPADGSAHGTVVAVHQLPVTLTSLALPKLTPVVYLSSELVNTAPFPLLPGTLNTFTGDTFTGSSQLGRVAAGEKFDLGFGSDDQLVAKREETRKHKDAGTFGKNRMTYHIRTEVQNLHQEGRNVTLRDQMPVAANEEIKVTIETPSLKPDEIKEDGTLTWNLQLKAGEKKEIVFDVTVEYPKGREVSGL